MSAAVYNTNTGLLQGHPEDGGTIHSHTYTLSKNLMINIVCIIVCRFYKREIISPDFLRFSFGFCYY